MTTAVLLALAMQVHVVAIGVNKSFDSSLPSLRYADRDAQQFVDAMQLGGAEGSGSTVLASPTRAEFDAAMSALAATAGKESKGKLLFYFSGHADERGLHLKDGALTRQQLDDAFAKVGLPTKVAFIDSCFGGDLLAKGASKADAFDVPRVEYDEPTGVVYMAATAAGQYAYETARLEGSLFTHYLVLGMYGQADGNSDGVVTVDELYHYVYREAKLEGLSYPGRTTARPEFLAALQGHGAVAITFPARSSAGLDVDPAVAGTITIASRKGLQVFHTRKNAGDPLRVRLPPGTYQVTAADEARTGSANIEVAANGISALGAGAFQWRGVGEGESEGSAKGHTTTDVIGNASATAHHTLAITTEAGAHQGFLPGESAGPYFAARVTYPFVSFLDAEVHVDAQRHDLEAPHATAITSTIRGLAGLSPHLAIDSAQHFDFALHVGYGQSRVRQDWSAPLGNPGSISASFPSARLALSVAYRPDGWNQAIGLTFGNDRVYAAIAGNRNDALDAASAALTFTHFFVPNLSTSLVQEVVAQRAGGSQ